MIDLKLILSLQQINITERQYCCNFYQFYDGISLSLIRKGNKCQFLRDNNYKMNQWIERNIIFPKINELKLKQDKCKEEDQIRTSIITQLKRNKSNSLYSLKDVSSQQRSKNLSCQRRPSPLRKIKKKSANFQTRQPSLQPDETGQQQGVKYINIIQLLEQRKHSFDSSPLKNMLRKLKFQQQRQQKFAQKLPNVPNQNGRSLKKRYIKSKLQKAKTEPHDETIRYPQDEQEDKNCLQIKKMTKFDIQAIARELQAEKKIKRKSFLMKNQIQKLRQTRLKITSIKGWNNEYEQLMQYC